MRPWLVIGLLAGCGRLGFDNEPTIDSAPTTYRGVVLAEGPVGYWRLGERDGEVVVRDETGRHDGAREGSCMPGVAGAGDDLALRFDPPFCMVTFGDAFDFPGTSPFTIESWVSPSDTFPFGHVFSRQFRDVADEPIKGYALLESPTGFYMERAAGDVNQTSDEQIVPADRFVHVVAVYDGTTQQIYIDGQPVGVATPDARSAVAFGATAMIGCSIAETNCFDGVIDEVALYDHALSPATISAHHFAR